MYVTYTAYSDKKSMNIARRWLHKYTNPKKALNLQVFASKVWLCKNDSMGLRGFHGWRWLCVAHVGDQVPCHRYLDPKDLNKFILIYIIFELSYIILYYIVLYYVIFYYFILYYVILYFVILYYVILYYIILCFFILYFIILYFIILYCVIWHVFTLLFEFILRHILLIYIVVSYMICDVIVFYIVLFYTILQFNIIFIYLCLFKIQ